MQLFFFAHNASFLFLFPAIIIFMYFSHINSNKVRVDSCKKENIMCNQMEITRIIV